MSACIFSRIRFTSYFVELPFRGRENLFENRFSISIKKTVKKLKNIGFVDFQWKKTAKHFVEPSIFPA